MVLKLILCIITIKYLLKTSYNSFHESQKQNVKCVCLGTTERERERGYLPEPGGSRVGEDGLLGPWGATSEEEGPDLTVDSPLSCLDAHTEDEREDHDVFLSNREYVNKGNIPS